MIDVNKYGKTTKFLFGLVLLIVLTNAFLIYQPNFKYWKYRINEGKVVLNNGLIIQLNEGWFPALISEDHDQSHVLFVKINPWLPTKKYLSSLGKH